MKAAANNRLITVHAMSDSLRLPLAYKERIGGSGVQLVHYESIRRGPAAMPESRSGPLEEMKTFFGPIRK
ncbi:MAG: hypothetical protein MRJ92_02745 [Nitrospira sp.]|nr:hypothetical protein [Nitrospira sp.]